MPHFDFEMVLAEAASAVPDPLVYVAAQGMCEYADDNDGVPCNECLTNARFILSHAYAYNPRPTASAKENRNTPCVACSYTKWNARDMDPCLFHRGMDHWITREWLPPIPPVVRHRSPRRRLLSFFKGLFA